ncbi:MAG TPA: molybdenum cofactor guanylyltransferase [Vicinamibacterales bacterium]|nr:molybdenum cofactor guanylyltransferase [Vicinamibacterales bacterium]
MTAAAILAGGRGLRLGGRDKAALPLGTARLIDRQIALLRPLVDEVFAVVARRAGAGAAPLGVPVVADVVDAGALGALYTAVVRSPAERTLVVACDLPFLTAAFLRHLLEAAAGMDAAVPRTADGWQPLCACYTPACAAVIGRRIDAGALKVVDVLPELRLREIGPDEVRRFDPDGWLLFNVNTPDDYARAQHRVASTDAPVRS